MTRPGPVEKRNREEIRGRSERARGASGFDDGRFWEDPPGLDTGNDAARWGMRKTLAQNGAVVGDCVNDRPPTLMTPLSLDRFAAATDPEAARYRLLGGLQETRRAFQRYCVYPHLAQLVDLYTGLRSLLDGADRIERSSAGAAVGVDWAAGRIVYAGPPVPLAVELARWALPRIVETLEEGRALYEFASEHAELAAVGLVPTYRDEGYLVVRGGDRALRTLRYRISALTGRDGRYRSLRTSDVAVDLDPLGSPQTWKAALVASAPDLPAPATFRLDADLDLPLDATLLPLAKRKLLGLAQAWGEA